MKILKKLTSFLTFAAIAVSVTGQVPDGFVYSAILRDATTSQEITGAAITVQFGIISGSPTGTLLYEEQHTGITTNDIGMFSLVIGEGSKSGGTLTNFSDIPWGTAQMYLAVDIYYNSVWKDFGVNPFYTVPNAMIARTAIDDLDKVVDNELIESVTLNGLTLEIVEAGATKTADLSSLKDSPFAMNADTVTLVNGSLSIGSANPGGSKLAVVSQDDLSEEALFEVKRQDGQTVFAVYSEGVRVFLPTNPATKKPKGGFAIGGFDATKGTYTEDYLWVTPDSIRMYIDKTPTGKGPKGGFAIGGFDRTKAGVDDLMVLSADSTRFYFDDSPAVKGPKGGFAIGGFNPLKGAAQEYMKITNDSTRFYIDDTGAKRPKGGFAIGGFNPLKGAGKELMRVTVDSTRFFVKDSTAGFGISNIESGTPEGFFHLDKQNYFIGHQTGLKSRPDQGAVYNSFIGYKAGKENTTGRKNVFLGFRSGETNSTGFLNVFIGNQTGLANTSGWQNIFIGEGSGMGNVDGHDNVFLGINAGQSNSGGDGNLFLGPQAGQYTVNTNGNVMIGYQAGALSTGSNNVFIGSSSGLYETGSFKFVLESNASYIFTPLMYGDFSARTMHINGTLTATTIAKSSDALLKRDIEKLSDVLPLIMKLNPVSFYYDKSKEKGYVLPNTKQYGLIAQEIEEIFPELVSTDSYGYKSIDYMTFYSLLIPAVQELKQELNKKETVISELKSRQNDLEERITALESLITNK